MGGEINAEAWYDHLNSLASLLESLIEKSAYVPLGPADGNLYMQLCNTFESYAKTMEDSFRENQERGNSNTNGGST